MTVVESGPDRTPDKGDYRAPAPSADGARTALVPVGPLPTAKQLQLWEVMRLAKLRHLETGDPADLRAVAVACRALCDTYEPARSAPQRSNVVPFRREPRA